MLQFPLVALPVAGNSSGARGSGRRSSFGTRAGTSTPGSVAVAQAAAAGSPGIAGPGLPEAKSQVGGLRGRRGCQGRSRELATSVQDLGVYDPASRASVTFATPTAGKLGAVIPFGHACSSSTEACLQQLGTPQQGFRDESVIIFRLGTNNGHVTC
jgi:hypothetical protein